MHAAGTLTSAPRERNVAPGMERDRDAKGVALRPGVRGPRATAAAASPGDIPPVTAAHRVIEGEPCVKAGTWSSIAARLARRVSDQVQASAAWSEFRSGGAISGVTDVADALVELEALERRTDGRPQGADGPGARLAQQRLGLGEVPLDPVDFEGVRGQMDEFRIARFDGLADPVGLSAERLSMITTSPGWRAGTSICSTQARNAAPFIGPSSTRGATTPAWRSPATKVVVFRWPYGTGLISRSPRGVRPRGWATGIMAQVSSRKASRSGVNWRCTAVTSARA